VKRAQRLLKLDIRVLRLAAVATVAAILLVGWGQFLRPAWQARQAQLAQAEGIRAAIGSLPEQTARADALADEAARLEAALDPADATPSRLPALLDSLARARGVDLLPVFPGQQNEADGLLETRYELEAAGSYPQLVGWLAAIETRLPNAGLQELRFTRQAGSGNVSLHLRLAVYRHPGARQP
jgi:Tfp pilus assembly protein PilO